MAEKDNANPIVHQAGSTATQRSSVGAQSEWWRDSSIHSTSSSAFTSSSSSRPGITTSSGLSFISPLTTGDDDEDEDEDDEEDEEEPKTPQDVDMLDASHSKSKSAVSHSKLSDDEKIDSQEVYDLIRSITDPEHPLTLEQLAVVNANHITVDHGDISTNKLPHILLEFTPTIPHCSMATLIGLSLRVRLLRALPDRFKVDIRVRPGTHQSENAVNKQLNDKERVAAALENQHLFSVVQGCLSSAARRGKTEEDLRRELESGSADPTTDGQNIWKTVEEIAARMGLQA